MAKQRSLRERLLSRTVPGRDGCILFIGTVDKDGYGVIMSGDGAPSGGRQLRAHRAMYELLIGPIPEGLTLDHLCRVRNCVNVAHLEPAPSSVNIKRGLPYRKIQTECRRGHEFTEKNTGWHPDGKRYCRTCQYEATARYRARKRANLLWNG